MGHFRFVVEYQWESSDEYPRLPAPQDLPSDALSLCPSFNLSAACENAAASHRPEMVQASFYEAAISEAIDAHLLGPRMTDALLKALYNLDWPYVEAWLERNRAGLMDYQERRQAGMPIPGPMLKFEERSVTWADQRLEGTRGEAGSSTQPPPGGVTAAPTPGTSRSPAPTLTVFVPAGGARVEAPAEGDDDIVILGEGWAPSGTSLEPEVYSDSDSSSDDSSESEGPPAPPARRGRGRPPLLRGRGRGRKRGRGCSARG